MTGLNKYSGKQRREARRRYEQINKYYTRKVELKTKMKKFRIEDEEEQDDG